eukprot:gene9182-6459_t
MRIGQPTTIYCWCGATPTWKSSQREVVAAGCGPFVFLLVHIPLSSHFSLALIHKTTTTQQA